MTDSISAGMVSKRPATFVDKYSIILATIYNTCNVKNNCRPDQFVYTEKAVRFKSNCL